MDYTPSSPIFVVGSHRSGTTAIANSISKALKYPSCPEGWIWTLLSGLRREMQGTSRILSGNACKDFSFYSISHQSVIPVLIKELDILHQGKFQSRSWLDKTPGAGMIEALPDLASYFENAKIVYCKRSGVAAVASLLRRFPVPFGEACELWRMAREKWALARPKLKVPVLEIEHSNLVKETVNVASQLSTFLGSGSGCLEQLLASFREFPEHTKNDPAFPEETVDDTGWTSTQIATFIRSCYPAMIAGRYKVFANEDSLLNCASDVVTENLNPQCRTSSEWRHCMLLRPNPIGEPYPTVTLRGLQLQNRSSSAVLHMTAAHADIKGAYTEVMMRIIHGDGSTSDVTFDAIGQDLCNHRIELSDGCSISLQIRQKCGPFTRMPISVYVRLVGESRLSG